MGTKHTKGEWFACCKDKMPHFIFSRDGEVTICQPFKKQDSGIELSDDEFRANAKLIAAAPELLEACIIALKYFNGFDTESQDEAAFHALNNAINKATK